jgi:hypothetical protein
MWLTARSEKSKKKKKTQLGGSLTSQRHAAPRLFTSALVLLVASFAIQVGGCFVCDNPTRQRERERERERSKTFKQKTKNKKLLLY